MILQMASGAVSIRSAAVRVEVEKPAPGRPVRFRRNVDMKQYLLSVYHTEGESTPSPETMQKVMRDVDALNTELMSSGAWVFAGGLHPPSTATVVRVQGGEVLTTDGPFAEGKEHVGGFWVIEAPDLDSALEWSRKATLACMLPVEVRPLAEEAGD
jgi:hypothetical protein